MNSLREAPADTEAAHFALLLELLRGRAPSPPLTGNTWAALIRLARGHMLLLDLKEAIAALHLELPFIAQHRLRFAERQQTAIALRHVLALHEILSATAATGLRIVPLKGPALLERLYHDPCRRPCADLDFVVHPADVPQITALLSNLGYRKLVFIDRNKWTWERGPIALELHGEFADQLSFPHDMAAVWARIQPSTFQGQPTWRLHPADELLFQCLHAARHRFSRLGWTVELARTFECLTPSIGFTMPPFYSARTVPGILLLGQAMIQRLPEAPPAVLHVEASPALHRRVAAMAEQLWNETLAQRWPPHTQFRVYQFLHQLEPTHSARLHARARQLWLVSTSINTADLALAKRFGLHHPRAVWAIRQLRLLGLLATAAHRRIFRTMNS